MQIIDSTPAALSADLQMYLRNGDVFFDIETTGLSWRTSHLYLIGALFFDPAADTFTLRQWFLDRPTEEKEMLVSFFTFLSDVKRLVHFILWYFKFFMCQCKNFYLHVKHLSLKHVIENFRHSFYTMFGFYHSV